VNCLNCTIYIAACEKIAFVDKCERITLTIATNLLRICNSVDSVIHYYGPSPVILTGDNRSLQIAPNNSLSPTLAEHMKKAGIPLDKQFVSSYTQVLCKPMPGANTYINTKPDDFNLLTLPPKGDGKNAPGQPGPQPPKPELLLKNLLAPD
jgi:hypothetical protein